MTTNTKAETRQLSTRRRPGLLLGLWLALLAVLAVLAPVVQSRSGLPYELLSLIMLAPTIAVLVVLIRLRWAPPLWHRVSTMQQVRASLMALVSAAVFAIVLGAGTGWHFQSPNSSAAPLLVFLALQLVGVLGEELGWRGFVQRWGEHFARPAIVSALAGFIFGATHLGYWSLGPQPVLTFTVTAMLMSLTITTLFRGSLLQRMIPAVIIHLSVNMTVASVSFDGSPIATSPIALAAAAAMLGAAVLGARLLRTGDGAMSDAAETLGR